MYLIMKILNYLKIKIIYKPSIRNLQLFSYLDFRFETVQF